MSRLTWHRPGSRVFQTGLDRGVLYLPNGDVVPWNGLTAVSENPERELNPVYFDGRKISDGVTIGDFAATMSAVTYPEEFEELEGSTPLRNGISLHDQPPQTFALCYRTTINNDLKPEAGYKIHVIYNITATPSEKSYRSVTDDPEIVEFEWELNAVPEDIPGMRPTAHLVIDTRKIDSWLLEEVEEILYGSSGASASLLSMPEFVAFLKEWYRVKIIDNGDGTWTAIEQRPGFIQPVGDDRFQIVRVNAVYLDEDTFVISDTSDMSDSSRVEINVNEDGTWTASTDNDNVIVIDGDGRFEIRAVDVDFAGPSMYRISDQTSEH